MPNRRRDILGRRARVAEMWLARREQYQIARELGVSVATISRDVAAIEADWLTRKNVAADRKISGELARLDAAERAIWAEVAKGRLLAVDRLLRIQERRAALLGLDAPRKIAPTTPEGDDQYTGLTLDELDQKIARILDGGRASRPEPAP